MASKAIVNPTSGAGSYLALAGRTNIAEVIKANMGSGGISPNDLDRIRVPSGGGLSWEISTLEGEKSVAEISGVMIHFADTRAYWEKEFDGGSQPPDCRSADAVIGIGTPGGLCSACPLSQFGPNGERPPCRKMRPVAILPPDAILPSIVVVPPSSLRPVGNYFKRLTSASKKFWEVVSGFSLEKAKSKSGITYSLIKARMIEEIDGETLGMVEKYRSVLVPGFEQFEATQADVVE